MGTRVMSSRFVGRTGELAECEAALREAAEGFPSVVALGGESGVGKTRLVRTFEERMADEARFLRGDCVDLDDGELPYAPLTAALRDVVRSGDHALERMSAAGRASLAALLPGVGVAPASTGDEDSAQLRLFESLLELLAELGELQPVVLVIEDLHWADRSTRAFTAFLARSLRRERVLFLFTYRSDELHRRHPLLPLLSELERGERTRRLTLRPWGREELGEALSDILGAAPGEDLLARMFARSEGNPLYTEELLAAGLDGRGAPPQSLRDAFMLRLERLPEDARRVLRVLAVARRADEELLAELAGLERAAATDALREAVAGHVVEVKPSERLAFRHALLREVAYEDLLPGERAALHLQLAHALERRREAGADGDAASIAQIAAHAYAGGDRRLALRASVQAAEEASAIHAHGEAAGHLERALESWPHVEDATEAAGIDHIELLLRAAAEHEHEEQRTRSESMLRAALAEVEAAGEPARAARILDRLARTLWFLSRGDEALATARRALELLPEGRDDAQRAYVLAWFARTTLLRGRYREAVEASREALARIAASGAGPRAESQARNTLGMGLAGCREIDEGIAELRRSLELARDADDPGGEENAYVNLADVLLDAGRTGEALKAAQEGLDRVQARLPMTRRWLSITVAETAFWAGEWRLAADSLRRTGRPPEGRGLMNRNLRRAELALGQGRLEDADADLAEIASLVDRSLEPQFHAGFGLALASLRRRQGRPEDARDAIEQALDRIELCTDDTRRVTALAAGGVAVEADIAQRAGDRADADELARARMLAELQIERVRATADEGGDVEVAWASMAEAELGRALGGDDPARWVAAADAWEDVERPYLAAVMRLRQAEAHLEAGQRDNAAQAIATALARARMLGAAWLEDELEGLAGRSRLAIADADSGEPAAERSEELPFGLTARELEVLALVAQGATNREIGTRLFMAEKTASVHVSRILGKLGVRSRTQAAAIAHRAGLAAVTAPAPTSQPVHR